MKFSPGPFVGQLSGKIGNTVAAHSRTGAYLRLKAIPVNPQSDFQLDIRSQFASLAQAWRSLSDAERESWDNVAQDINRTDALGLGYTLSGLQAYVYNNMNRLITGVATVDAAPSLDSPPIFNGLVFDDLTTTTFDIAWTTPTPLGASIRMKVFATRPLSLGIQVPGKSEFRLLGVSAANDAAPTSWLTQYNARFGDIPLDTARIWLRASLMSANYWDGLPQATSGIAT